MRQTRSNANKIAGKSTKLSRILPLITVWFLVRIQAGPPIKSIVYRDERFFRGPVAGPVASDPNFLASTLIAELPSATSSSPAQAERTTPWTACPVGVKGFCATTSAKLPLIHDLRHTLERRSWCGIGLPVIGKLLGHTQASTTQRYAHLDTDPLRHFPIDDCWICSDDRSAA